MIKEAKNVRYVLKNINTIGIYITFVILFIVFSALNPNFMNGQNLVNIIVQSSIIAIIGVGQTLIILTGGIDLSVGSIVAFTGIFTGLVLKANVSIPIAIFLGLLSGALIGLINGSIVSLGKVPSFVVTLGTMGIFRGAALLINSGQPVSSFSDAFEKISETNFFHVVPIFAIYCIVIYAVIYIVLKRTRFGRHIYAVGGNRQAAWLSGVNVKRVELLIYVLCGLFAAIAGIMLMARMNYASPTAASDYNMDSIAAVIIGGTAMTGGKGSVLGTLVGALFLGMLQNGLTILNVSDYAQQIIIGVVIIAAVFLDRKKESR